MTANHLIYRNPDGLVVYKMSAYVQESRCALLPNELNGSIEGNK
jgi:hypothetical protein